MHKIKIFISLLLIAISSSTNAINIQVRDTHGNINYYPLNFIEKSEYFQGTLQSLEPSQLNNLLLPLDINTLAFNELYAHSKSHFIDVPLEKLTQYFVLANALSFTEMQKELLHLIYNELQKLGNTVGSVQAKKLATKKILRKILALPQNNFDEALARAIYADQLTLQRQFQQAVQRAVRKKHPDIASPHNGIFALLVPDKLQLKDVIITDDPENKIINIFHDGAIHKMSSTNLTMLVPQSLFDYSSVYLGALTNHGASAYLNPDKIILYYNTSGRSKRIIIDLPSMNSVPWSHIAFSADTAKLTGSHTGSTYIIDYMNDAKKDAFLKLQIPHQVFSSILLTDNDLLYRTFDGKTYMYDLEQKTSHPLKSKLDYYTLAVKENGGFRVYGLENTSTGIKEISEYITTT